MKILYITLFCVNLHTFFSVAPQLNEKKLRDQKKNSVVSHSNDGDGDGGGGGSSDGNDPIVFK